MKLIKFIPVFLLLLDACIEPLKVNLIHETKQLVVDGLITNEPGPYQVKLFYSSTLDNTLKKPEVESKANIWVISDNNESERLSQTDLGLYQTSSNGIRGQVGRSYKLRIVTALGEYETDFQKLHPAGTLDSVLAIFDPQAIGTNNSTDVKDGIKILVNAKGIQGEPNLFRWRYKNIYKVKSYPELRTEYPENPPSPVLIPVPEPCSGYIRKRNVQGIGYKAISQIGPCTCCICWSTEFNSTTIVSENKYIENNQYSSVQIGELEVTSMLFYEKVYIEVEQLSMSEDVYNFWKLVEVQEKGVGNLFQPNAIKIRGNVHSVSNPAEEVLGVFATSAIVRKAIFINNSIVPHPLPLIDTVTYDCRNIFKNSTTEKPPFW